MTKKSSKTDIRKEQTANTLTTFDLFGSGAKYATVEEMKKLLDKLRAEDQ